MTSRSKFNRNWVVINKKTNKIAWMQTGSKRKAFFKTRQQARDAIFFGETCMNGRVIRNY